VKKQLYMCALARVCREGTADIPPYWGTPEMGPCPHSLPHDISYNCHVDDEGCSWSDMMGFIGMCKCHEEDKVDKFEFIQEVENG
jgi:hypothetical protein